MDAIDSMASHRWNFQLRSRRYSARAIVFCVYRIRAVLCPTSPTGVYVNANITDGRAPIADYQESLLGCH
jgi:hypothetical protein